MRMQRGTAAAVVGLLAMALSAPAASAGSHAYRLHVVKVRTSSGKHQLGSVDGIAADGTILGYFPGKRRDVAHAVLVRPQGRPVVLRHRHMSTLPEAMSSDGTVVFEAYKPHGPEISRLFLRRTDGTVRRLRLHGVPDEDAGILAMNNNGVLIGVAFPNGADHFRSFISRHGRAHWFRLPLARSHDAFAHGINDNGVIVGDFSDRKGNGHGFVDRHGGIRVVDLAPHTPDTFEGTSVFAIADDGSWVAITAKGDGTDVSYVHLHGHHTQRLVRPEAGTQVLPRCINDDNKIGGVYLTQDPTLNRPPTGFVGVPRS